MSQELEELPLFPLNTVLFPYAHLHLHIFEERYREMVRTCVEFDRPFGIVLIREGSETGQSDPYMVGTAVRIIQVHTYDDGRMDIQVRGERRFRIRRLDESRPYMVGMVEPVIEMEIDETGEALDLLTRARQEFELLVQRRFPQEDFTVQVVFPPDPVVLSFTIANLLPMENLDKQRFLETTDTLERVQGLIPIIEMALMESSVNTSFTRLSGLDLGDWITPN